MNATDTVETKTINKDNTGKNNKLQSDEFLKDLLKEGIERKDAEKLSLEFSGNGPASDFIESLYIIGEILNIEAIPRLLKYFKTGNEPKAEPWVSIYKYIELEAKQNNTPSLMAFSQALGAWDHDWDLQQAISNAAGYQMGVIQELKELESQQGRKKESQTEDYKKALKALGYTFRVCIMNDTIEVNNQPITDFTEAKIVNAMTDRGFQTAKTIRVITDMAADTQYHPIREYLDGLTYDGGDYIQALASYFNDEYGMIATWLRKWMIGAVAKVYEVGQNPMLVLDGPQGIGKSVFARWLASPMEDYFIEGPINTNDKDCEIRLISNWIWEVSELGTTTRKSDYEALKAFLTTRKVSVRKPYGKHDINKPALASFIGTINNSSGIFSDPTGSRRFLTSKLVGIVWDYSKDLTPDQVWAEAAEAFKSGESWQLVPDEIRKSNEINTEYDVPDVIEGLMMKFFELDNTKDDWWIPTSDILAILKDPIKGDLRGNDRSLAMDLGKTMTRLGHESKRRKNNLGNSVNGYTGIKLYSVFPGP